MSECCKNIIKIVITTPLLLMCILAITIKGIIYYSTELCSEEPLFKQCPSHCITSENYNYGMDTINPVISIPVYILLPMWFGPDNL